MPGGQYTNLREQARSMGLEARWQEVAKTYAEVNQLFGDIVKVTPSSKVVGDMALFMVASDLDITDVRDPQRAVSFPDSVVSMMRGELGYPADGFPPDVQQRILQGTPAIEGRAGAHIPAVDLEAARSQAEAAVGRAVSDADLASWLMYPKVFSDYIAHRRQYGDVSVLPTPVFFYGMSEESEMAVDIEQGKTLVVRYQGQVDDSESAHTSVFFELNGQPRPIRVERQGQSQQRQGRPQAEEGNAQHVGAPMPGAVAAVAVKVGQRVTRGTPLLSIEAMKMENAISAPSDGVIAKLHVATGDRVDAKDLLLELQDA